MRAVAAGALRRPSGWYPIARLLRGGDGSSDERGSLNAATKKNPRSQDGYAGGSRTSWPVYLDLEFSYVRIKGNFDLKSEEGRNRFPWPGGLPCSVASAPPDVSHLAQR